jgi:hypothetical protein
MTRLISAGLFAAVLLFSSLASATNGYVCSTRRNMSTSYGSAGAAYVSYYTAPDCAGSFAGSRYYCSSGASSSACTSNSSYLYGAAELNTFMTMFQTAALEGSKISFADVPCGVGGGTDCGGYFYVYGMP